MVVVTVRSHAGSMATIGTAVASGGGPVDRSVPHAQIRADQIRAAKS